VRGEVAAHPAFVDAVRAGDAVSLRERKLECRREIAVGSGAERPLTWGRSPLLRHAISLRAHAVWQAPILTITTLRLRRMSIAFTSYPIGTSGVAWGAPERAQWLARQRKLRSYADDVATRIERLARRFDVEEYGQLDYPPDRYRQLALRSRGPHDDRPWVLITGGVHGYETSGVHGAFEFLERRAPEYAQQVNFLAIPCVSPWAYERIHRWNANAVDPNRSFREDSPSAEAAALLRLIAPLHGRFLLHVDLHETTDSDESEFRPALAARDGQPFEPGVIPDGFYLVDDSENPQPEFQRAIIEAVAKVAHIAPPDERNEIIGSPLVAPGVIEYPMRRLGLCAGITGARYTTTTEVYPDGARTTPELCNEAQVVAVCAAIGFALRATAA
jgi:hypothetical protein